MIWMLMACLPTTTEYIVRLSGTIDAEDDGPIYAEVLLTEIGEGSLTVSMAWVSDFALEGPGTFSEEVLLSGDGVGLAVYAWQDTDGDGLLCALDGDEEPTGAGFADFPATEASVTVALEQPCLGPERYAP